jgi:hypothetical protein
MAQDFFAPAVRVNRRPPKLRRHSRKQFVNVKRLRHGEKNGFFRAPSLQDLFIHMTEKGEREENTNAE